MSDERKTRTLSGQDILLRKSGTGFEISKDVDKVIGEYTPNLLITPENPRCRAHSGSMVKLIKSNGGSTSSWVCYSGTEPPHTIKVTSKSI